MKNRGFTRQNFAKKISGGFTLIELLVVIAVIGILASVVLASLNSARVKARNARRVSDIKQLYTAFHLGLSYTSTFPSSGGWVCVSSTCYQEWDHFVANSSVDAYLAPSLPTKPADPAGGREYGGYLYSSNWGGNGTSEFPAGAVLEWVAEPVGSSAGVCGPAKTYATYSDRIFCILYL